jgi:general secretion pathway protein M
MGLRERIEGMDPREQKLLLVLVSIFGVMVVLLIPLGVMTVLSQRQTQNEDLQHAIDQLHAQRDRILDEKAQRQKVIDRYKKEAPALAGFLTKLADASQIEIPEIKDRPPVPIGKQYEERSTGISLKQVGMFNLLKFMERIAQAQHPVSVSKLNIKKRSGAPDQFDVEMIVSAFHRLGGDKSKEKKTDAADEADKTEDGAKPEEGDEKDGEEEE